MMSKKLLIMLLRALILFLILLPILKPYLTESSQQSEGNPITVFYPSHYQLSSISKQAVTTRLKEHGLGQQKLNWTAYGHGGDGDAAQNEDRLLQADELVRLVQSTTGLIVTIVDNNIWGPAARRFNTALKQSDAFIEKRLFVLPAADVFAANIFNQPDKTSQTKTYLAISEVFLPALQFIGDVSQVSVEVVGQVATRDAGQDFDANIVVRTSESVLATQKVVLSADEKGVVNQTLTVPVTLIKTGTQALRVQLLSDYAYEPLNQAFAIVNAVHAKTSLLHVAVGPDWSLRNLRQRLKFWPNLDLISYYILRELGDDFSIPETQLTLIQFPTHKLFDEELPNFHGIIAQNFPLDIYLREREPDNLINYVKNGGRLVLFGGPLTFESQDARILSLMPCENKPDWDAETFYRWEPGSQWMGESRFREQLEQMSSHFTAINCIPKRNALVIAQTQGETKHPTIVAMNVGKGLVLLFLSGDWHTSFAAEHTNQVEASQHDTVNRNLNAIATKEVFQWMTEFLQRRQDSGLRPPEIISPRLYAGDTTLLVRARGLLRGDERLGVFRDAQKLATADVRHLSGLDLDILQLSSALGQSLPGLTESEHVPLHLNFDEGLSAAQEYIPRATDWTIFSGKRSERENLANPTLLSGLQSLVANQKNDTKMVPNANLTHQPISLVYPWLLGLALLALAVEQFLTHILWRAALHSSAAHTLPVKDLSTRGES